MAGRSKQQEGYKPSEGKRAQGRNQFPAQATQKTLDKLTGRQRKTQDRHQRWSAEVSKAELSDSRAHQEGKPYQSAFEYSEDKKNSRCVLLAEGNHEALTLTLVAVRERNDPNPRIVADFSIPREGFVYSIRLFDQSRSMDVHVESKPKTRFAAKARAESRYWKIAFRAHDETELYNTKRMLRRVENLTLEMPDEWFNYRNYFTRTPNVGNEADEEQQSSQASVEVGRN
ncbi:MAG: hypothetical protein Q9191_003456 [Dirinaria sp. TL-2023a]